MTTEHKHTPLPYVMKRPELGDKCYYIYRADENGKPTRHLIALLPLQGGGVFLEPDEDSIVEMWLTPNFIVRACNSHHDLLEALEAAIRSLEIDGPESAAAVLRTTARAAIAKAKGDSAQQ